MNQLSDKTEERFKLACQLVKSGTLSIKASQEDQLKMYSFFKQATVGPCREHGGERPSFFAFEAKYKYDAWDSIAHLSSDEAMVGYCSVLDELSPEWDSPNKSQLRKDWDAFLKAGNEKNGILSLAGDMICKLRFEDNQIKFDCDLKCEGNSHPFVVSIDGKYPDEAKYQCSSLGRKIYSAGASNLSEFLTGMFSNFIKKRDEAMELLIALENE